jgi:hypothetical protein
LPENLFVLAREREKNEHEKHSNFSNNKNYEFDLVLPGKAFEYNETFTIAPVFEQTMFPYKGLLRSVKFPPDFQQTENNGNNKKDFRQQKLVVIDIK